MTQYQSNTYYCVRLTWFCAIKYEQWTVLRCNIQYGSRSTVLHSYYYNHESMQTGENID